MNTPLSPSAPYQKNFAINQAQTYEIGGQTSTARLVAAITVAGGSPAPDQILIRVCLQGSSICATSTGSMSQDDDFNRMWYIDQLQVNISPSQPSVFLLDDAPTTQIGSTATTSSSSCGFNASAGTFMVAPTVNVDFSETYSNSFTLDLSQQQINNVSSPSQSMIQYFLASSEGASYSDPTDLSDEHDLGWQYTLYEVPSIAYDNIPLLNIAGFLFDPKDASSSNLLTITLKARYAGAHMMDDGYNGNLLEPYLNENVFTFACPLDLGQFSNNITFDPQAWIEDTPVAGSSNWVDGYSVRYAIGWLAADGSVTNFSPWCAAIEGGPWSMPTLSLPTTTDTTLVGRQVWRMFGDNPPECIATLNDVTTVQYVDDTP